MRLLAPLFAVSFLALLIGCGGGGTTPSFGDDTGSSATDGSSSGNGGGPSDFRAPVGSYTTSFAGNDGATAITGTGTAVAASDGTINVTLAAANTSNSTARSVTALVSTSGAVTSGSVTVGTAAAAAITSGSLAKQANGSYLLTVSFASGAATATDRYTLSFTQTVYSGSVTGTDNQGGTYSGSGGATLSAGNSLSLTYLSRRSPGTEQTHTMATTLRSDGTFTGTLDVGQQLALTTGTWALGLNAGNVPTLTLVLNYVNPRYAGANGNPTVKETLVFVKQ